MYILGTIPTIWFALITAPYIDSGLIGIIQNLNIALNNPFDISWSKNSMKVILIFLLIYWLGIAVYESTRKNYRRKEEHGSAKWGIASELNKKYKQSPEIANKILTKNVRLGLNGKKHKRNLNVLVVGRKSAQVRLLAIASLTSCKQILHSCV